MQKGCPIKKKHITPRNSIVYMHVLGVHFLTLLTAPGMFGKSFGSNDYYF